ncbi:hypothetical protein AB0D10_01060 [Kitasatospora sp. NPDC048545]|uniref:hypothetical protein n=1 Tax=Kitasatospora sp. NPDC048545 TaxID=3157208 RepID=UPI003407DD54
MRAEDRAIEAAGRQEALDAQTLAELKNHTELATLLEINQRQIDQYHAIATGQADRSFVTAQRAMASGLLVIMACFIAGLMVPSNEVRWFLGALGAVGAAISAYLSKTFLFVYKESQAQLNRYFDQPVLNGYYLTAERLADGIQDGPQGDMRRRIIEQVLEASTRVGKLPEPVPIRASARRPRKVPTVKADVPAQATADD